MRSKHKTLKKWISGLVVVCLAGFLGACQEISVGQLKIMEAHGENETQTADKEKDVAQQEPDQEEKAKPEDAVFSYLQGTKSYEKEKEWSGAWCYEEAGGQQFSQFGCGLCSMANVYSTVSGNKCTPLQMYEYAQEVSTYNPHSGLGAIGWDAMRETLQTMGMECEMGRKPSSYEEFQQLAKDSRCLLVLISSNSDDTFWKDMPGHYVTLWLYDEKKDEVFLADSSGPSRNREWIPLQTAYDALKRNSPQQYLSVTGYDKNEDAFHVSCASYMLCKKYGMDTSRYNFLHAPEFFEKMETQEVRVELSRARDAANAISARMAKVLAQNRNATYRESETEKTGQDSSEKVKDKKENPEPEKKEQKSRGQHRKEAR